jgi:hypothetical protein
MDAKYAVLAFQHGERLKSEFTLLFQLLATCSSLKGEKRIGARAILDQCINIVGLDLLQASRDCNEDEHAELDQARTALDQISIYLDRGEIEQAIEQAGCAISAATTVASHGWQGLVQHGYF